MRHGPVKTIHVVMPVFDDWAAAAQVIAGLEDLRLGSAWRLEVLAIDDGSSNPPNDTWPVQGETQIRVLRLACNLGHQRAIAVGLVVAELRGADLVIVMDADGEDRPQDIPSLLSASLGRENEIVVAERGIRSEGWKFRIGYQLYKIIFRGLAGTSIKFGNFCLIPKGALRSLVHNPALWNNLAAAISRSRLAVRRIKLDRGRRLAGRSQMAFSGLALHGLSAISVYADVVLLRLIAGACLCGLGAISGVIGVAVIRLGTDLAIPGWASYIAVSLLIVLIQAALVAMTATFQLLNSRSMKPFMPITDALQFVDKPDEILGAPARFVRVAPIEVRRS